MQLFLFQISLILTILAMWTLGEECKPCHLHGSPQTCENDMGCYWDKFKTACTSFCEDGKNQPEDPCAPCEHTSEESCVAEGKCYWNSLLSGKKCFSWCDMQHMPAAPDSTEASPQPTSETSSPKTPTPAPEHKWHGSGNEANHECPPCAQSPDPSCAANLCGISSGTSNEAPKATDSAAPTIACKICWHLGYVECKSEVSCSWDFGKGSCQSTCEDSGSAHPESPPANTGDLVCSDCGNLDSTKCWDKQGCYFDDYDQTCHAVCALPSDGMDDSGVTTPDSKPSDSNSNCVSCKALTASTCWDSTDCYFDWVTASCQSQCDF